MNHHEVRQCHPDEFQAALKCLHSQLSPDQQAILLATLDTVRGNDPSVFHGLLGAFESGYLVGATWVQFTPGSAAVVWPPSAGHPAAEPLMLAVDALLYERRIKLAQILVSETDPIDEKLLGIAGFRRLVDLAYYTLERTNFPSYPGERSLEFVPRAGEEPKRLAAVIAESYVDTLDCPELNRVRSPEEVVAGYKAQGVYNPNNWFLVRYASRDVGVLILSEHPPGENWELVYMGIAASARGHGWGEQIVGFATEQARHNDAQRLVLAVDERNSAALTVYRRAGFVLWDRRTVYARLAKYDGRRG